MKTIEMKDVKVGEREEWLEKMEKDGEKMISVWREIDKFPCEEELINFRVKRNW